MRGALLSQGKDQWLSDAIAIDAQAASVDLGMLRLAAAARPLAFQTRIDCAGRAFVVGMDGDVLTLRAGDADYALAPSPGSDERFAAITDPSTFVQTQGASATVSLRGTVYRGCNVSR